VYTAGGRRNMNTGGRTIDERDRGFLDIPILRSLEYPRTKGVQALDWDDRAKFLRGAWGRIQTEPGDDFEFLYDRESRRMWMDA